MEQLFKDFLEAISPALQTLLLGLVTIILGQVSLYIKTKWGIAKSQLSSEQQYFLELVARNAVQTVEQVYQKSDNATKRQAAIDMVEESLIKYGVTIDLNAIANVVEAQVFNQKAFEAPKG